METFDPYFRTFTRFSRGRKTLTVRDNADDQFHVSSDYTHMNDDFGELFIRSLIEHLRKD